jgi:SAM-dependent methyltransferase
MEGHREYVGGDFERIGLWQFNTLKDIADIQPNTTILDIACGSLRLGKHLIPYLNTGKYYGLEAYDRMLNEGIDKELHNDLSKRPSFAINSTFDFNFCPSYDVAWANSLFSHLVKEDIAKCFSNLKTISSNDSVFYFTYFEENQQKKEKQNPTESHARKDFYYKQSTMEEIANSVGWKLERAKVIHPRSQTIMKGKVNES